MGWAKSAVAGKIRMLGRDVVLQGPEGTCNTRAIIDPVSSVSQVARTSQSLADGYFPPGSYQYFGLPEGDLTDMDTVMDGGDIYLIRRKELYRLGKEKLYWWGILIRGGDSGG